jgi:hypothetical protein
LDHDAKYHPLEIKDGNVLVYDLGTGMGIIERRIIDLEANRLTLESTLDNQTVRTTYVRGD